MSKKKASTYKEESKAKFNEQAATYDTEYYGVHARQVYGEILEKLKPFKFNKLLDIGFGTGSILSLISSEYTDVQLAGIDLAPNMIEIAREKLGSKADLRLGDSENLPFDDDSFDMVTCTDSFHHYPHPENVLTEIKRVLKPGGGLLIADPYAPAPFRQLINHLYFPYTHDGDVKIYSKSDIVNLLESTGFKVIEWEKYNNAFIITAHA